MMINKKVLQNSIKTDRRTASQDNKHYTKFPLFYNGIN